MQSVEFEGYWWPPGEHENRVGGVLSYEPESGATLNLFESFESGVLLTREREHEAHSRLYGLSKEGDLLTLVDSHRDGFSSTQTVAGNVSYSTYQPRYVLDGIHVPQNKNISFTRLTTSFPGIEEWTQHIPSSDVDGVPGRTVEIVVDNPDPIEAKTVEYTLTLSSSFKTSRSRGETPSVPNETRFHLYPKHPAITLSRLRDYIYSLRGLLTIATNHPIEPRYVQARTPDSGFTTIDVYYGNPSFGQPGSPGITNLNFRLPDIPNGFSGLIERWFGLRQDTKSAIDLFLGTQYNPNMYRENIFLSLTQAIESYHRRRYQDEYMDSQKYESGVYPDVMDFIRGDLNDVYDDPSMFHGNSLSQSQVQQLKTMSDAHDIPNDLGNVLDSAIKYANEYSLRKRFKELVNDEFHSILTGLPHSAVGQIHPIVETRNHHTHQLKGEQKDPAIAEGADLTRLTWSLEQLLEVAFLAEIGVSESQIRNTLYDRYKQYRVL
ncbi:HEPN domain-containing protein [Natronosalvus caseinilyticus]|uniref:ApeA N-terminal domain 1-containing protein n=1 Tax=Natronosalvus caseinilyticus TaxID=2953747 RepID=UPI0028B03139|nr:HEPN domain-containing protein [Natronosalvus caseinilyticus]